MSRKSKKLKKLVKMMPKEMDDQTKQFLARAFLQRLDGGRLTFKPDRRPLAFAPGGIGILMALAEAEMDAERNEQA